MRRGNLKKKKEPKVQHDLSIKQVLTIKNTDQQFKINLVIDTNYFIISLINIK
jgi:hypothetical protein